MTSPDVLVDVFVPGKAESQGSMKVFGGRVVHSETAALRTWRDALGAEAWNDFHRRLGWVAPIDGPVGVTLRLGFPRPKSWPKSAIWKPTAPDVDKLARAVLDALTKKVWTDDARVCQLFAEKVFARTDVEIGARLIVKRLENPK